MVNNRTVEELKSFVIWALEEAVARAEKLSKDGMITVISDRRGFSFWTNFKYE